MTNCIDLKLVDRLVKDAEQVWPENFADIEKMFNSCCFAIAFNVIKQLELFQRKDDFETMGTIKEKVNLFKDAEYVMSHILRILCDEEVLEKSNNGWICLDTEPYIETPAELLVMATRTFPEEGAPFQWLARASDGIVSFIKGKLYAEEVMFPLGSFKLVEEVYNTSNVYGFYSRLAGKAVKRLVEAIFDESVTLIEIGAGTGNGTANVLNEVNNCFDKYIFTDVSKSLVQLGQRRFKKSGYGFLEYKTFDACKDLSQQDFEEESADIVLAVNVIHATDDILVTLDAAKKLLKNGGILILSEIAPQEDNIYRYMELTFGLLPSYAAYNDKELRSISPIIRPSEWVEAMEKIGFSAIEAIPGDRSVEMDRGGIVIAVK
ncbi:MAG: class I SAM-dependent methyltransferase [Proteobacteria bacterium]|nr:class I SAM-dependent methyltransferase [Pseudomonadota bacterium]